MAGHVPPLLVARGGVRELHTPTSPPVGLGRVRDWPGTRVRLEGTWSVLLYTDGVVEARTPDGDLFGLDRLADLLEREAASGQQTEELLRRLVRAVLEHQGSGLRDDATLLLVQ